MATQLTIPDTIRAGHVSAALATLYASKKSILFGGTSIKRVPPIQIQIISDVLEWAYDGGAETDQNNRLLAGYLYWLCGLFQLQAQNIISGPGGGSVAPTPSGGGETNAIDFEVSALTRIPTGGSTLLLDGTNGNPDWRGYKIVNFVRGGIGQNTTNIGDGSSYYTWNSVTGLFSISPAATVQELFRITPDAVGGSDSPSVSSWATIVVTNANFEPDGITLNNSTLVGSEYYLFVTGFNSEPQFAGTFFNYTATGLEIIWPGFDAANFGNIIIQKIN